MGDEIVFTWVSGDVIALWFFRREIAFFLKEAIAPMGQGLKMRSLKRFVHRHSFQGF
jgi:hypothetical protein